MKTKVQPPNSKPPKEALEGDVPDTSELEGEKTTIDKAALKAAMKEAKMEENMQYSVEHKNKEELNCLIKLAQERIKKLDECCESEKSTGSDSPMKVSHY